MTTSVVLLTAEMCSSTVLEKEVWNQEVKEITFLPGILDSTSIQASSGSRYAQACGHVTPNAISGVTWLIMSLENHVYKDLFSSKATFLGFEIIFHGGSHVTVLTKSWPSHNLFAITFCGSSKRHPLHPDKIMSQQEQPLSVSRSLDLEFPRPKGRSDRPRGWAVLSPETQRLSPQALQVVGRWLYSLEAHCPGS